MSHLLCLIIVLVTLQSIFIGKTEAKFIEVYEIRVEIVTIAFGNTGLIVVPGQQFGHVKAVVAPTVFAPENKQGKNDAIARILKAKGIALVKGEENEAYMVVPRRLEKTFTKVTASRYVFSAIDGINKKETKDASTKIKVEVANYDQIKDFECSKITQKAFEFNISKGPLPSTFKNVQMTMSIVEPGKFSAAKFESTEKIYPQADTLCKVGTLYLGKTITPTFGSDETNIFSNTSVLKDVKLKITGFSVAENPEKTDDYTLSFTYAQAA